MKRKGRCESIEGSGRETCRMLAVEPALLESGGRYLPSSRKDLMLAMRRREEAEGERRMMGSGLRPFLSREAILAFIGVADAVGALLFLLLN